MPRGEEAPQQWEKASTKVAQKKTGKKEYGNYRDISLVAHTSTISLGAFGDPA